MALRHKLRNLLKAVSSGTMQESQILNASTIVQGQGKLTDCDCPECKVLRPRPSVESFVGSLETDTSANGLNAAFRGLSTGILSLLLPYDPFCADSRVPTGVAANPCFWLSSMDPLNFDLMLLPSRGPTGNG